MWQMKPRFILSSFCLTMALLLCCSCTIGDKQPCNSVIILEGTDKLDGQQTAILLKVALSLEDALNRQQNCRIMPLQQSIDLFSKKNGASRDTIFKYLGISTPLILTFEEESGKAVIHNGETSFSASANCDEVTQTVVRIRAEEAAGDSGAAFDFDGEVAYYLYKLGKRDKLSAGLSLQSLRDRFREVAARDSSENRDIQLRYLLEKAEELTYQSAKANLLQVELYLALEAYSPAFLLLKEMSEKGVEAANVSFLLSKFSNNRLKVAAMEDKTALRQKALELVGPDVELLERLGESYYQDGLQLGYSKINADRCYAILAALFPHNLFYKSRLSFVRFMQSDLTSATVLMEECLALDSLNPYYHYHYGTQRYFLDKGDKRDVVKIFKKAISLGDSLDSYLYLGKIYYLQGEYDTALRYFRQRVRNSFGAGDKLRYQALKGIRNSLREKRKLAEGDSLKNRQQGVGDGDI